MVIHLRPHCSATYAVVPLPHVGSRTRSPGSVVIRTQREITLVDDCTTYNFSSPRLDIIVSDHAVLSGITGKSSRYRLYANSCVRAISRPAHSHFFIPSGLVDQNRLPGENVRPWKT